MLLLSINTTPPGTGVQGVPQRASCLHNTDSPGVSNAHALTGQKVNKTTDTDWGSPPHLLKQGLSLERAL